MLAEFIGASSDSCPFVLCETGAMNARKRKPPSMVLAALNHHPIAQKASLLLQGSGMALRDRLYLAALLEWATANLAADPAWAAAVDQSAVLAETHDPAGLQRTLLHWGLMEAQTLEQGGRLMLSIVSDLILPGSQPA